MEKLNKNLSIIILLFVIAGCMFILNISTLKSPDDYSYSLTIAGDDLKITSFSEITDSAKYLYNSWTGRILPHILIGIFMTTSTVVFKVLNTILFVILLFYITKFITSKSSYLSIIVAFGFLVYGTMFGEKFAWISGSLNYLWTSVALYIYLYTIYGYFVENRKLNTVKKIIVSLSGLIIGFSHEVIAFVGGSFLGMIFLANVIKLWKNNKKDLIFLVISIFLFGIGAILTIIAPGNIARSTLDINQNGSPLACLGNYRDIKWQLIIMISTMIGVGVLKRKELLKKEFFYFIFPCIIATIPFSIMGYFPPRCFLPYEILLIIITCTNLQTICEYYKEFKKVIIGISIFVTIIVFARMLPNTYSAFRYVFPYKMKVTKQLEESKDSENKDVVVSKFLFTDKIRREDMINIDNFFIEESTSSIVNIYMSLYYKFDKLRAVSDIDYLVQIETDITENVDYGIVDKNTLELIKIVPASTEICFTIPKEKFGTYVVDCRDKDLRNHVLNIRIRGVGEEVENPNIEDLINQE